MVRMKKESYHCVHKKTTILAMRNNVCFRVSHYRSPMHKLPWTYHNLAEGCFHCGIIFVKISLLVYVTVFAISLRFNSKFEFSPRLWMTWLWLPVNYSVGYRFGFFISLEIISFSQTVKETSRAGNHPVWTSKCTGGLVTNFVAQMRLITSLVFTWILNQANH